jgi:hypothetical protein
VLLCACKAVPRFGGTRASRCETGRKEATGRAACQVLDERTGRLATPCSVGGGLGVDCGVSPRRCRVVCVRLARQGLPEEGGGLGGVAGSRQTCLPAIGGRHGGSERGRSRET